MSIRSKLAWTFILLLIFGITAISSYSILFIRNYMLEEGVDQINKDTQWLVVTIENLSAGSGFEQAFREAAETSGYQLALYDRDGVLFASYPDTGLTDLSQYLRHDLQKTLEARNKIPLVQNESENPKLISYAYLPESNNAAQYIRVSQFKDQIYAPIKTIRWIIYYGMFISIALVIIVSIWISRYLTKPITQIKNVAHEIAGGDVDRQINLNRKDEFGDMAESLNQMASKLREDTKKIRKSAIKQQQFFADITHEIRNPLHTISGALELLEMDTLPEDQRKKYLKNAQKQTERIGRLFKDLVTLQRYDSDEYFIEEKTFDLAEIGQHIHELYDDKAEEKSVDLQVDTHSCKVLGDPGKIEQVVDNLVSNAIKYTNEGSVTLHYDAKNGEVKVQVQDTGIGISQEHLDRLFDRFYRTDKARSRDKGGTGLGLAVVKSILSAHGREIHVDSTVEKGSTFWFTLPAK
ncbi:HAMP domain-containing histidine kinase [Aliifodinibius sp. S!AR15-10]|uniref:sensor histidine kinase n=1 Tax=Aliifodinibius sp. S!AR15-10 TaxID=2950437 RepID=UPI00285E26C7|nr:HAMP domain-containing sensor histidine kinase [Aliifodinibius sp. S!AR15-10]MDR8392473.1 HAMP domain-containing histidine kinase [Aliifodinibius sp. S!AR15-10]